MNFTKDWRDDADSVKDKLKYTLTNENTQQDVVIIVGIGSLETVVKAHSFMLILGSQVFEKLLETAKVNNEGFKEIKMSDVRPEALRFVLKYIYLDCVNMEAENALDILYVSLKLNLRRLAILCVSKLRGEISVQNVQHIFEEAQKMDVQELVQASQDFILKNARDVFEREQFLNITKENLSNFLASDELEMDEVSLFKFIMRWGEAECQRLNRENNRENLRLVLERVLPLIRYPLMTSHQFATVVVPTNILDYNEVIDVYNYLSVTNSDAVREIEPPQWIFSSAVRKTVGEHPMVSANNESESNYDAFVEQHGEPENTKKERLLKYLQKIKQTRTICGLFCMDKGDTGIQTIVNITGVQPGILTLRMPSYLDRVVDWQPVVKEIISHWNNGILIHIQWLGLGDLPKHLKGSKTSDETLWQDLIEDNGQLNKEWKNHLDAIAPYFKQLQNAGVVVICDLLPYINYKISSWRGRPGNNGSVKFYQITQDYLTTIHDLNSILWTWCLHIDGDMTDLEEYWPGNNYVDIASVYMGSKNQLEMKVYHKLLELVGNKPISLECIYTVPTPKLLANQPGWTWFTVYDDLLEQPLFNNDQSVKTTFQSLSVISKGNNEFFKTSQSTLDEQTQVHTVD